MTTISVFGGTGFFGRRLVQRVVAEGASVRVAVRHSERARSILDAVDLDRVTILRADVRDQASVAAAVAGADAVVNAVSAYVEKSGVTFEAIHEKGAETVAREAAAAGVGRLVLLSGIGADPESRSPYIRARGRGELVVRRAFPGATIVRPGAMFGPGDALFGTLATLVPLLPVLPLIGGGGSRLQPVYVEDVADAVTRVLADSGTAAAPTNSPTQDIHVAELIRFALRRWAGGDFCRSFALAQIRRGCSVTANPPLTILG
jgi:NADH dehydrogenase